VERGEVRAQGLCAGLGRGAGGGGGHAGVLVLVEVEGGELLALRLLLQAAGGVSVGGGGAVTARVSPRGVPLARAGLPVRAEA